MQTCALRRAGVTLEEIIEDMDERSIGVEIAQRRGAALMQPLFYDPRGFRVALAEPPPELAERADGMRRH